MSVSTQASRIVVEGDGVTTAFTYNFLIPGANSADQTNAQVVYEDALGNLTTLNPSTWSITGVNVPAGGTVVYDPGSIPISTGTFLAISRIVPYTQPTVLSGQGAYPPSTVENALDTLAMQIQQLNTEIGLKIGVPITDDALDDLPTAISRISKLVGFDVTGAQPEMSTGGTGGGGGTPGGTNGQTQYNNAGAFGGYTWSGDVTITPSTGVTVIGANAVTNAKLATIATASFKGRTTAGTGNVEDLTATQATALLNAMVGDSGAGVTKGLVPAASTGSATTFFLRKDGTWAAPAGTGGDVLLAAVNAFTKTQHGPSAALSISGGHAAWDASTVQVATLSVNVNTVLDNPTNLVAGETFVLIATDTGGSHTLTFGTAYKWAGGTAPTLSAGSGAVDVLSFVTDGTNMYGSFVQNFS